MRSPLGNGNISPAESSQGSYWVVSASMPRPLHRDPNENPYGPPESLDPSLIMSCFCAVVVAQHSVVTSVGIDIETTGRIDRPLWKHLFTDEETEHLLELEPAAQSRQATAFFSIKEAFYKYQFPITHAWVGFRDVTVRQEEHCVLSIDGTDQRRNSGQQCRCRRRGCWH